MWWYRLNAIFCAFMPFFVLLSIRGLPRIPDCILWIACAIFISIPITIIQARIINAIENFDTSYVEIEKSVVDNVDFYGYIFSVLIPIYSLPIGGEHRDVFAFFSVFIFIFCVFYIMRIDYIIFYLFLVGYKVHKVYNNGELNYIYSKNEIISKKGVDCLRIFDRVYVEYKKR